MNLDHTKQRFISTLPITTANVIPKDIPATSVTIATNNSQYINKNSDFHHVPVIMNNNMSAPDGTPKNQNPHQSQNRHYAAAVISITTDGQVNRAMPAPMNPAVPPLVQILPVQPLPMNGSGASVNFYGGSTTYVNSANNNTTSNVNNSATLIPLIASAPQTSSGGLTIQQPAPTLNVTNINQNNNGEINTSTLAGQANSITNAAVTPMSMILPIAGNSTPAYGMVGGTAAAVMQPPNNSRTSIVIRNQHQYAIASATQRSATGSSVLNQEMVKQIVVGNAAQFTCSTSKNSAKASNQTILKPKSTTISSAAPRQNHTPQQTPEKVTYNLKIQQSTSVQKRKLPLAEAAKAAVLDNNIVCSSSSISSRRGSISTYTPSVIGSSNINLRKHRRQTMTTPCPQSLTAKLASNNATHSGENFTQVIKENTNSNLPSAYTLSQPKQTQVASLDFENCKKSKTKTEAHEKPAKMTKKQQSLLKAHPLQRILSRSKSLNLKDYDVPQTDATSTSDRRHSSDPDNEPKSSNKKQDLIIINPIIETIDLVDSSSSDSTGEVLKHNEAQTSKKINENKNQNSTEFKSNTEIEQKPNIQSIIVEDDDENVVDENNSCSSEDNFKDIKLIEPVSNGNKIPAEDSEELFAKSLYCDEKIFVSSTSSASTTSSSASLHEDVLSVSAVKTEPTADSKVTANSAVVTNTCSLKMTSTFNMLNWNQRIGTARGTEIHFRLNEFNLLEINEHCPPRSRIYTSFEKPIYERKPVPNIGGKQSALIYSCRRCNCKGPASEFLAPEFCSLECLKRNTLKRRREELVTLKPKQPRKEIINPFAVGAVGKKTFRWSTYLPEKFNAIAAPVNLFLNPFPTGPNGFQIGMKLEAIDPENCSLFCVCSVVDIQGYRLKLTFDGYDYTYDFWINADSMDIFPPGWCAKTKRILQPPKGKTAEEFNWSKYLIECRAVAAPRNLFTHLNATSIATQNPFTVGMHLEADDLNDTGKLCVASVADVLDNRIRIHFDGWDDCYDYWADISSPHIHPCGYHVGRQQLIVPPDFESTTFFWEHYVKNHGTGMVAAEEFFVARAPIDFKPHMKLEAVDPRNSSLIRPTTVLSRKGYRVKLHLDCWPSDHTFWLEDDSADLHPIGWCENTGHELEPPPGYKIRSAKVTCPVFGCRGVGNAKRLYVNTHATRDCCPYAAENWRQKLQKELRIKPEAIVRPAPSTHNPFIKKEILKRLVMLDKMKTEQRQNEHTSPTDHKSGNGQVPITRDKIKREKDCETEAELQIKIQINKEYLRDYGPRLIQNYKLLLRNCSLDEYNIQTNPVHWSISEACSFVQRVLKSSSAANNFRREDIDGSSLLLLEQADLTDILELKLGPAVKLYSHIIQLRSLAATKFNIGELAAFAGH